MSEQEEYARTRRLARGIALVVAAATMVVCVWAIYGRGGAPW